MKIYLIILLAFLISCDSSVNPSDLAQSPAEAESSYGWGDEYQNEEIETADVNYADRKLIKTGVIEFETADLKKTTSSIKEELKKVNAYVSQENETKQYDRIRYHMQVRIPSEKFEDLLASISSEVKHFDIKSINTRDVTEQFVDLQVRIRNKKAVEERYTDILKKASTIKDILEVESKLSEVRLEIESLEGKMKLLSSQTLYSTLDINYYRLIEVPNVGDRVQSFPTKIGNAFKNGFEIIKYAILGITTIWPLILAGFVVWFIVRIKK